MRKISLVGGTLTFFSILSFSGCSKGVSHDGSPPTDPNGQSSVVTSTPAPKPKPTTSAMTPGGDPIDMTALDGQVAVAEKNMNNSGDEASRKALAHAYLARASALTKARQYRSALGDYRRTLKHDPQNKEASDMSNMIVSILNDMKIPVPPEGQEPPPKPMSENKQGADSRTQKSY